MNALFALAEAGAAGQIAEIARSFGVDGPHLAAQIASFAIVCALLHRFAYRPVLAMLAERRRTIAESLANAERIKAELARTDEERRRLVAEVNARAARLIEEARAAAAAVEQRERQKAVATADGIVAGAREQAARDRARMLAELKREVGRLVVQTTAAVAGKVLTPEDQRRLAEETAKRVTVLAE
jgi:F-type H+-transporting ATPase subunit b